MDSYLRWLAECKVDTHEFKLNLKGDPKMTLTCLDRATETSDDEISGDEPSVRPPDVCPGSLYDAIREMRAYEAVTEEETRRNDSGGLLRNP